METEEDRKIEQEHQQQQQLQEQQQQLTLFSFKAIRQSS